MRRTLLLWVAAFLITAGAAVYQRRTGPTYPARGSFRLGGRTYRYRLIRSGTTGCDARVRIPDPGGGATGVLLFRRYRTRDPLTEVPLRREGGKLAADLPSQPPAGKLVYHLRLIRGSEARRVPADPGEDPVIRFKGAVPAAVLLPHILLMFLSMLVGVRAGLAGLLGRDEVRRLAWVTLGGLTLGGMILGPVVQKYAFGAFWTGFPLGFDLTDNKTLIMWVAWLAACGVVGLRPRKHPGRGRIAVGIATVVMLAVYLIPHSLHGSELDYGKLDRGVPPSRAIDTR